MARQLSEKKELDDMTECSICTEVFTDPRVLPCIHTFCLKCLLNYGKERQPGDNLPCPLCRKEFTIPDDGLSGMPKNLFVEKLLHARRLSVGEEASGVVCDVCVDREGSGTETSKRASMYCVQCQQNYCEQCSWSHTRMKLSADHVQVEIGKQMKKDEIASKLPATYDIHKDNEEVSVDLRKQVKRDTDMVTKLLRKTREVLPRFEKEKNNLIKHLAGIEDEVNTTADKLIAAIQRDRVKLLSEVESIRLKRVKQLETAKQEVEQHKTALESFKRYSETLLSGGTACDETSAKSLHDRADELMMFDVVDHVDNSLPPLNVTFLASTALDTDTGNVIGSIFETDSKPGDLSATHVIPTRDYVGGVASLGNDVFVLRRRSQNIEVYDATTITLQRSFAVPQLGPSSYGLAVCPRNKCIYASDYHNNSIHRVELKGSNAVMKWKWSVASKPAGLTVNKAQNLLVVSNGECKLQEFTTRGTLLRIIQLQFAITGGLWHAIDLATGQFVVSCREPWHHVCLVDVNGKVTRSNGVQISSKLSKMNSPAGLAVDKHENIVVADEMNNRLLVFDRSLTSVHVIPVSVDDGLRAPHSLWYDKSRGRLCVGEWQGRVVIIDHLVDFTACQV